MIKIGILGDIGSGKSYIARCFRYPVFNADNEVSKLYKNDIKVFKKLKKSLPKFIYSFPISKNEITRAILFNKDNLKKIVKIVHLEIKKKMNVFLKKHENKKIVVLDIPLLLENKINSKKDILVFVESKKSEILKRLKNRNNYNKELYKKFKNIQLPLNYKKNKSQFIIKNDFTDKSVKRAIKNILSQII
ncbi:dephospho-CoA kinase [Candidatus Pelagibacter communis]|uniref:dephospho-CoA kinase n=1 Tax=Pelagibacter ubique TaxID=198252 RepID=UPI00094D9DF0|nr:dephospho-CoA kinase [Candidatus Pelagibacter ubique]|tara:strand:- start:1527 stop:2096 length:570 start_codon:yes stop_codon:yes gene_type:complete